ncbi:MAG: hypothetical protein COZ21_04825, partial [Bacteroidetes bacterium CG_4_10_14_3_um_filter_31_20]
MKKYNALLKWFIANLILLFFITTTAQTEYNKTVWQAKTKSQKTFIENKGQFSDINAQKILFANFDNAEEFYFTAQGLIIKLDTLINKKPLGKKILDVFGSESESDRKYNKEVSYFLYANWQNANTEVKIEVSEKQEDYYTFRMQKDICYAYKKITYKNIYPNIDIEYTIPNDSAGIKYN